MKYALSIILIILGAFAFWFGNKKEAGINPIKGVAKIGGGILIVIGVIIGGVKMFKQN